MIHIIVSITVTDGNRPFILPLLEALTVASQHEAGNISYQYYAHPTDTSRLAIIEQWESAEVLAAHETTEHFVTLLPQIGKLASTVDIQKFNAESIR